MLFGTYNSFIESSPSLHVLYRFKMYEYSNTLCFCLNWSPVRDYIEIIIAICIAFVIRCARLSRLYKLAITSLFHCAVWAYKTRWSGRDAHTHTSLQHWCNGNISAFQAEVASSILVCCSTSMANNCLSILVIGCFSFQNVSFRVRR